MNTVWLCRNKETRLLIFCLRTNELFQQYLWNSLSKAHFFLLLLDKIVCCYIKSSALNRSLEENDCMSVELKWMFPLCHTDLSEFKCNVEFSTKQLLIIRILSMKLVFIRSEMMKQRRWNTTFDDLDGDINMVFPPASVNISKVAAAQLLLQGELFFGEFPLIHCKMT